jgi:hypothetical protein
VTKPAYRVFSGKKTTKNPFSFIFDANMRFREHQKVTKILQQAKK